MKTGVEMRFGIEDVTAKEDATLSSSPAKPFSNLLQLHDDEQKIKKWGTAEGAGILLDGTNLLFPNEPENEFMGFWSIDQTDEEGLFAVRPELEIHFTGPHSSLGLTLTFSESSMEWASKITAKWFDGAGDLLAEKEFAPDAPTFFLDNIVEEYYKIHLSFHGTNRPFHWLKITGIRYGILRILGDEELTAARVLEETSILSDEVRVNTLSFSFYNQDGEFDLLGLSGAFALFQQRQEVEVTAHIDGVPLFIGMYYLAKVKTISGEVQISCTDLIGAIENAEYLGGLWRTGIAAGTLIAEIMAAAGTSDLYELDAVYESALVKGYLPISSPREALQQVAFVLGATVNCARSNKIMITAPATEVRQTVDLSDKVSGHTLEQSDLVTGVEVYSYEYYNQFNSSDISREMREIGDHLVRFGTPSSSLSCVGAAIIDSGVNFALLRVTTPGEVTLSGRPYQSAKRLAGSVHMVDLPAHAKANVFTSEDCTLTVDPQALAQRIYDYKRLRITENGSYFPLTWTPGDKVQVQQSNGSALTGFVSSLDINLFDGLIAKVEVVGGA